MSQRPDTGIRHRLPRGGNVCDFCGANDVIKLFACHNFQCGERNIFSRDAGHWACCHLCSRLVTAKDWTGLTKRVMREVRKREGVDKKEFVFLRKQIAGMHADLEKHLIPGFVLDVHSPTLTRSFV